MATREAQRGDRPNILVIWGDDIGISNLSWLTKAGVPASPIGLQAEDPTIAELLENHGYATGQFGKNHLGDRNDYAKAA